MTIENTAQENSWFYSDAGERKGAVSEPEIVQLIKSGKLGRGASVWKKGAPDWLKVEDTDLGVHLAETAPPLTGEHVNNSVAWVLAFAPIIGFMLQNFVAGAMRNDDAESYWYIAIVLNISLSYFDEKRLIKAGVDTKKFRGFRWLVPVYLYQRSQALKQNLAYFIVWIVCFVIVLCS